MFSKIFIDRPRFAAVISIVLTLAGVISVFSLPITLYPQIAPPEVVVSTTYPGASAEVLAKTIGAPLEEEINGVEDMIYMSSSSENSGRYSLTVTFKTGINPDIAQVKLQNRLQQAMPKLPAEVQRQGVRVQNQSSDTIGFLTARSPKGTYDVLFLSNYIENNIKNNLSRVDGVGGVSVFGSKLSMRVWLDVDKITSLNMSVAEITSAIESQNVQASLGKVGSMPGDGKQEIVFTLQTDGRLNDAETFSNIVVRTAEEGGLLHLKDIARIEIGRENYSFFSQFDGANSIAIRVDLLSGANALKTMDLLKAELNRLEQFYPEDFEVVIGYDATKYIESSIEEVVFTLVLTFLLVVAVCYLFLQDWRATLIPSLTIPVSLFATFSVLLAFGYSINLLTLFGLVLAIALVVDDAILVVERVLHLMEKEKLPPKAATIKAMEQVTSAIIATTVVLLGIFLPIGFISGIVGKIYQQFAVSISTAIIFSSINALTLSPALCASILKPLKPATGGIFLKFNSLLEFTRDRYGSLVALLARKISVIVLLLVLLCTAVMGLLAISQTSFIPDEDQGVIFASIQLPEGASIERTQAVVNELFPLIKNEKGVSNVMSILGFGFIAGGGENVATTVVILDPWAERDGDLHASKILGRIRAKIATIPNADINLFMPPAIPGLGMSGGLDFRLQSRESTDPQELYAVLQDFLVKMNQIPGILYAFSGYTSQTPHLFVDVDRKKAELMKVPVGSIFSALQTYLGSIYVNDVNFGTQVNRVMVQADWKDRKDTSNISGLFVQSANRQMVPLGSLVSVSNVLAPRSIQRYNQYPSASITALQLPIVSTGTIMNTVEQLAQVALPKGYSYEWSGMSFQEKDNQGQIGYLIMLAITFGYLFLVAQYESWTTPIPVLTSVSVAMIGALFGLFVHGLPLSIYAQLGLILLVGLASKNAILIVEFSAVERQKGSSIARAGITGLKERYRAVLMTAFTFILGMLPLIVATGAGAGSRVSLGIPVFYGMLLGTIVGLPVIPLLYVLFQTMREKTYERMSEDLEKDEY